MIISERHRFVYVSMPRAGSHTMFAVLCEHYGGVHRKDIGYHANVVPDKYLPYFTFSTCRNPYSRAVSIWRATTEEPGEYTRQFPFAKLAGSRSFTAFARWLARLKPVGSRRIVQPQVYWLRAVRLDTVLHLETLDVDVQRLPFWTGPAHVPHAPNRTDEGRPDWRSLYTPELAKCIRHWAGDDFEAFGYSRELTVAPERSMITLYKDERVKQLSDEPQRNAGPIVKKLLAAGWQIMKNPAVLAEVPPAPERPPVGTPVFAPDGPLVSVVMPALNAGEFIGRAIRSMQKQTLRDWELCIVCDGGSKDDTYERAVEAGADDDRIMIISAPHAGYAIATDCCLCMTTGRMIARLDADDEHHPARLERQAAYLAEHPVDAVTCDMVDITRDANGISNGRGHVTATGAMDPSAYVAGAGGPCHASVVAWRWVYDKVGGFDPDEEWDGDGGWNLRAIRAGIRWGHIDAPWYYHRRYPQMRSEAFGTEQNAAHEQLLARHRAMEAAP